MDELAGTQIFDRVGDTINSGIFTQNIMNQILELNERIKPQGHSNEQNKEEELDEEIRRFEARG